MISVKNYGFGHKSIIRRICVRDLHGIQVEIYAQPSPNVRTSELYSSHGLVKFNIKLIFWLSTTT
jgi:hypothetical protein